MQTRDRLHRLIDDLPETELDAVERLIAARRPRPPFMATFANAPEDDEPLTPEDETALAEAYADVAAGRVYPHDEVRRRLLGRP